MGDCGLDWGGGQCGGMLVLQLINKRMRSVLPDEGTQGEGIGLVDGRAGGHQLASLELGVPVGHPPGDSIAVKLERAFDHVQRHPDDVLQAEWLAVFDARGVAAVPELAIVDCPAVGCVAEGLLHVDLGPGYPDFYQRPFVDLDLEVVSFTRIEKLAAKDCLKAAALDHDAGQLLLVELEFVAGAL